MAAGRRQPALARAANAMMRALGGASIKLRIPVASTAGTQRELGIAESAYQEAQLAPVIVRELAAGSSNADTSPRATPAGGTQIEVLISSSGLDALMPALGATDGWSFLQQVEQIVYADMVFAVTGLSADRFAGLAYMYHVTAVSNQ